MRPWLILLLIFSTAAVGPAQKTSPSTAAPEIVPIDKEPSHHLVFENEYVRVFSVEVAPHSETKYHQHDRDYVWVSLGDSDVESVRVGAAAVALQPKDGDTQFTKGGFAHKAVNKSDKPFKNVTVELKRTVEIDASGSGKVTREKSQTIATVFISKDVSCWKYSVTTGMETTGWWHSNRRKYLIVASDAAIGKNPKVPRLLNGVFEWGQTDDVLVVRYGTAPAGALLCEFVPSTKPQGPSRQKPGARDDKAGDAAPKKGLSKDKKL